MGVMLTLRTPVSQVGFVAIEVNHRACREFQ